MKIIFFGSDDFAAIHLDKLIKSGYQVVACVTPPNKKKGRGMKVILSPVKMCASKNDIPIYQPINLKEDSFKDKMKEFDSDLFIVIAYGKILPSDVLDIPRISSINLHSSLLPRYRGAAPINWAIINGEKETGISVIKMNEKMDSGDIISQKKISIDEDDDAISLREKMSKLGPDLLIETIQEIFKTNKILSAKTQDDKAATYAPKLTKKLGCIDWNKDANEINNLVKGLLPWPGAYTFYGNKILKILSSKVIQHKDKHKSGEVISISKEGIKVATSDNSLLIKKVQLESSKAMDAQSFVIGHKIEPGFIFGDCYK